MFEFVEVEANSFVDSPADAVSADGGLVDFFGNDDCEAGLPSFVVAKNETQVGTTKSFAVTVNVFNSSAGVKSVFFA